MMDYSVHMLARSEHEQMVRSVPTVSDFGAYETEPQRGRTQVSLFVLRSILAAVLHFMMR